MKRDLRVLAAAGSLVLAFSIGDAAFAQKQGGTLKIYFFDSPASMSIHEETTAAGQGPMMGVFNNLVLYRQDVPQSGLQSIVPDLASDWSWDEDKTQLSFRLREGVNWHDGKPFTAKDVQCTWDLLAGKSSEKLCINPRKAWYKNLEEVTTNGDYEVTFHLNRPQPAFIALLASGFSPVYPCHVSPRDMRSHPIGTGPFKFVEFKPNESIKVTRYPDYWKKDRPYLDSIEYTIIKNVSTGVLAFVAGKVDMTSPYFLQVPVVSDVKNQAPEAICHLVPVNVNRNVMMNRDMPPFNDPDLRRAMALSLDRKAFVDTLTLGKGDLGGVMQPPPEGIWGMPPEMLRTLPGYDPDVQEPGGSPPDHGEARLPVEQAAFDQGVYAQPRTVPGCGDNPDRSIEGDHIDGELEPVDTVQWYPKVMRGDYTVGLNLTGNGLDDPDQTLYENFTCGAEGNYCNPELDKMVDRQSMELDQKKRKELVWAIERKLAEDAARPILWHNRTGTCWQPYVKGYTLMVNSVYNGWRMEDVWLDK
jgi:peptide/nickel transport system substrate-binding protein